MLTPNGVRAGEGRASSRPPRRCGVSPNNLDSCVVEWDGDSYVGKAVQNALDKQQALSDALSTLLNDLPATATAEQQAALEEAMLQCDRRIGEIETEVLKLTELVAKGPGRIDGKTLAALDRRVVDLAGEKAIPDHYKKAADMIPAPFKFTGNVKVKLDVHVDSLREMPS